MEFQEYHSATSLGLPGCRIGGRSGCLASGARPRFKKRPPHKATSYSTSYSASTNSGLKEKREVDGRENCWIGLGHLGELCNILPLAFINHVAG